MLNIYLATEQAISKEVAHGYNQQQNPEELLIYLIAILMQLVIVCHMLDVSIAGTAYILLA